MNPELTPLIRVVIVDDSPFMVRCLMASLRSTPDVEVVGTAINGERAVALAKRLRPDVITLDVEMPQHDGLDTLSRIMEEAPTPVVMVSGVSNAAAKITLEAIKLGAVDFLLKYVPGVDTDPSIFQHELVERVRSASRVKVIRTLTSKSRCSTSHSSTSKLVKSQSCRLENGSQSRTKSTKLNSNRSQKQPAEHLEESESAGRSAIDQLYKLVNDPGRFERRKKATPRPFKTPNSKNRVVVIGASTGGPAALRELLSELDADFPAPIIVVQHMPSAFTGVLAAQLDRRLDLHVREAWEGDQLQPGTVLITPGDWHMQIEDQTTVVLNQEEKECGHRPSIDVTMKSIVEEYGSRAIGIILTGMGDDGCRGLKAMLDVGCNTFAQEASSCVVNGMPAQAARLDAVQITGTPRELGRLLAKEVYRTEAELIAN